MTFLLAWKTGLSPLSPVMGSQRFALPFASLCAHAVIYLLAAELCGTAASDTHITLLERCILEGDKNASPGMLTCGSEPLNGTSDCRFEHGSQEGGGKEEESQMFVENK